MMNQAIHYVDLLQWLVPATNHFPRAQRFTVTQRLLNAAFDLGERLEDEGLTNVEPVLGTNDDPNLPADSVDWILLVDVYHEFQQPKAMLAKMREALKPDGRVALLEYRLEGLSAVHIKTDHRMSPKQVLREWEPAGFRLVDRHEFLPTQHFFVFEKAD